MTFQSPVEDLAFALSALGHDQLLAAAFPDLDTDAVRAVLEAAGQFCDNEIAPLNRPGDLEGSRLDGRQVRTPKGFAEAYKAFVEGGWNGLAADPAHGGQGLTKALATAVSEMLAASNLAFSLCPMLTAGSIEALSELGSERQKTLMLPKLISGVWTGAMALTEPQAGTDLAALSTRAEPDGQGGYRITGQKIFITWGDHDVAENVCHLVLARLPDAPPGVKGISLFLASKQLIDDEGRLGERNSFWAASLEHKLGIHASPTCVMIYEDAQAELVGAPHQGLAGMFVMMNAARLQVGVQGVALAERAYQAALGYARERRQGRTVWNDAGGAILDHPDVRRMLMLSKAKIEAARGVCLMTAVAADLARVVPEADRAAAKAREELLTPIAKAWSTDIGVEVASLGVQVHGGMGFIEETGAAQYYRDARITPIYEGTNGIQAMDLIGRKLRMGDGAAMASLIAEIEDCAKELRAAPALAMVGERLAQGAGALRTATDWIRSHEGADALTGATAYLQLAGEVVGGWVLARQALAAGDRPELAAKGRLARFYAGQVLSGAAGLAVIVAAGAEDLQAWTA